MAPFILGTGKDRGREKVADPVVYIVDDDDAVRSALSMLIGAQGWGVHVFGSAAAFLDAGIPSDEMGTCLLLDIDLAGMNGTELLEYLRAAGHALPTVMVTARPKSGLARRAGAAGASAVLGKPFVANDLIAAIHQAIDPR